VECCSGVLQWSVVVDCCRIYTFVVCSVTSVTTPTGIENILVTENTLEEAYNKLVTGRVRADAGNITTVLGHRRG